MGILRMAVETGSTRKFTRALKKGLICGDVVALQTGNSQEAREQQGRQDRTEKW